MTTTIVLNGVDYEWAESATGICLRKAGRQKAQVGATKTVNGKTYYLNDNRRWALKREGNTQPKAKQEPRQKSKQVKPKATSEESLEDRAARIRGQVDDEIVKQKQMRVDSETSGAKTIQDWLKPENFAASKFSDFNVPPEVFKDEDAANAFYKKLAREIHPDRGGTTEQMASLNALRGQILALVEMNGGLNEQKSLKPKQKAKAKQVKPKLQALDGGGQASGRSEFAKPAQQLLQAKQGTDAAMGRMMETKAKIDKKHGKKKPKAEKIPIAQIHKEVKAMAKQVSPEVLEKLKAESRKGNRLYARPLHEKLKAAIGQGGQPSQLKPKLQALDGGGQSSGRSEFAKPAQQLLQAKQGTDAAMGRMMETKAKIEKKYGKNKAKPQAAKENLAQQIQAPNSIVYVDEDSPTDIVVTSPENKMRTEAQFASQGREMQMFGRQHKTFLAEYANLLAGGKPSPMSLISPSNLSLADAISTPGARVFVSSETPGKFAVAEPGDAGYMRLSAQLANADEDYIELSRQQFGVVREYLNAHKAKQGKLQALDGGGQSRGRSEFAKPAQQLLQAKQGTDAAMGRMMETKAKIDKKYGKKRKK